MELIKAKYHAEQLADELLLAYWATDKFSKTYHLDQVQNSFELLAKAMGKEST